GRVHGAELRRAADRDRLHEHDLRAGRDGRRRVHEDIERRARRLAAEVEREAAEEREAGRNGRAEGSSADGGDRARGAWRQRGGGGRGGGGGGWGGGGGAGPVRGLGGVLALVWPAASAPVIGGASPGSGVMSARKLPSSPARPLPVRAPSWIVTTPPASTAPGR